MAHLKELNLICLFLSYTYFYLMQQCRIFSFTLIFFPHFIYVYTYKKLRLITMNVARTYKPSCPLRSVSRINQCIIRHTKRIQNKVTYHGGVVQYQTPCHIFVTIHKDKTATKHLPFFTRSASCKQRT